MSIRRTANWVYAFIIVAYTFKIWYNIIYVLIVLCALGRFRLTAKIGTLHSLSLYVYIYHTDIRCVRGYSWETRTIFFTRVISLIDYSCTLIIDMYIVVCGPSCFPISLCKKTESCTWWPVSLIIYTYYIYFFILILSKVSCI
jgi:hypothetical protein